MNKTVSFEKRISSLALIFCFVPQVMRIILNCIYVYEIDGNIKYGAFHTLLFDGGAELLGRFAFFSAFALAAYLVYVNGMKNGKEWYLVLVFMYGVAYVLLVAVNDYLFGVIAYLVCTLAVFLSFVFWIKEGKGAVITISLSLFMSVIGGVLTLFASEAPTVVEIIYYCFYGLSNMGFELLLILGCCILTDIFVGSALKKGKIKRDMAVSGKLVFGSPVLKALAVFDIIFILINTVSPTMYIIDWIVENSSIITGEDLLLMAYEYAELVFILIFGYAVMRIVCGMAESNFIKSEKKYDLGRT